jgi:hypothetical protein
LTTLQACTQAKPAKSQKRNPNKGKWNGDGMPNTEKKDKEKDKGGSKKPMCSYAPCGKLGHTEGQCHAKHLDILEKKGNLDKTLSYSTAIAANKATMSNMALTNFDDPVKGTTKNLSPT